jgi:uracil-DNA glycosylase
MDKDPRQELCEIVGQVRGELALQLALGVEHTDLRWPEPAAPAPMVRPTLEQVREELGECTRCKLHAGRTQIVFGVGNPAARLVFVGEAPGADEDAQGEPFVGRAGQLLTKIIEAMGLRREDVYICNIIKCRPPSNRTPEADEILACQPFLLQQLQAIGPKFICALGGPATQTLLQTKETISRLRGRFHDFHGIPLLPTFHPAFLLRNPNEKKTVWEDMKLLLRHLQA